MAPLRRVAALAAVVVLVATTRAAAQQRPDPCTSASANPTDTSIQLSLKDGQTVFHEGEIMGLSLAISSTAGNKYVFDTRNYDRGGRLDTDTVCVEPAVVRDPLGDYFRSGLFSIFGGGLSSGPQVLSVTPAVVDIDVNEWKALPPGRYHVRVISGRIDRQAASGAFVPGTPVPLVSNVVELDVVAASSEWQAAQFNTAVAAIDSGATDAAKRHGARVLRFLDSEASARELARRYWSPPDQPFGWEFMFGLVASSHRPIVIASLKEAIRDPAHAISQQFVNTLALLEIQSDSQYQLPAYSEAIKAVWTTARDRKMAAYHDVVARHLGELSAARDGKTGQARAICLNTLLMNPGAADPIRLRPMLASSWDFLPVRMRNEILQSRWDEIGGPDLLPILWTIVSGPPNRRGSPEQPDRGAALRRLYEIAPREGRELILHEILDIQGDIGIDVLGRLPDRELLDVDVPLMARLRQRTGYSDSQVVAFELVDRYATAKPLFEIQGLYDQHRGRWACALQAAMLRYFLRVDQPYGIAQVADALRQRAATGCYQSTFSDVREALAVPEIERMAIAALDDVSPEVVRSTAQAMSRYGSPAVEAPLWRRLETLHQDGSVDGNMVEYDLMNALAGGQAWTSDTAKLERLRSLVSPSRQSELDGRLTEWHLGQFELSISWPGVAYNVAGYTGAGVDQLAKKLKQFPAGSKVVLSLSVAIVDRHQSDLDAVRLAAITAGVVLDVRK